MPYRQGRLAALFACPLEGEDSPDVESDLLRLIVYLVASTSSYMLSNVIVALDKTVD